MRSRSSVWGGVRSLAVAHPLDLLDEFRLDRHPYVAGEWYPLFDDVARSHPLDLVSTSKFRNGTVERH